MSNLRLGVIGYGTRIRYITQLVTQLHPEATVAAIADPRAAAVCPADGSGPDLSRTAFYDEADAMLDGQELDGVLIGTRCRLHTPMAAKVLERRLPLFLEKPVATSLADLGRLRDAAGTSGAAARVVISFPLRVSPLVHLAKRIIDSGRIGTVEHAQAWNDVPYGAVYYQSWYRDEDETGGLFLQKATHDFDYLNFLLGTRPRRVSAMTSKRIFRGPHPAGLHCKDCGENRDCAESPFHPAHLPGRPGTRRAHDAQCAFAVDTGNEDSGSALVQYESGMHLSYSQNFFARKKAARRGARLSGYEGTLEFDWYTNTLRVFMHHTGEVETHQLDGEAGGHGGGDGVLADNFVRVIRGEAASVAPLSAGLLSALMCLRARESAQTGTFQEIAYPSEGVENGRLKSRQQGHETGLRRLGV